MHRAAIAAYAPPSKEESYLKDIMYAYYNAIGEEDTYIVDQDYVLNLGLVHAAINGYSYELHDPAQVRSSFPRLLPICCSVPGDACISLHHDKLCGAFFCWIIVLVAFAHTCTP